MTSYKLLGKTQLVQFSLPCSSPKPPTSPTFLFAGQFLKLAERACHLGHILSSDLLRGFKLICAVELTATLYPVFMLLIPLSRPSYFTLSVFLSMALHYGDCHPPVFIH